jgi:Arc/MetJ-type ribon-helix-helix transcriptional regulator
VRHKTELGEDQLTIRLGTNLHQRIAKAAAADRRRSVSEFVRNLLADALDSQDHHAA